MRSGLRAGFFHSAANRTPWSHRAPNAAGFSLKKFLNTQKLSHQRVIFKLQGSKNDPGL